MHLGPREHTSDGVETEGRVTEMKAHTCSKNQGVAGHLNAFERSSIKRIGNHL